MVDVREIATAHIKACFYGANGRGKTSLACQFPKPLLLVSFEPSRCGGPNSVVQVPGVKVLRYGSTTELATGECEFTSVAEAVTLGEYLRANGAGGYATIVVDGVTGLQRRILEEMMKQVGRDLPQSPTFGTVPDGMYQIRSEKLKTALVPFIECPCHVILTAKEKDHNPPREYNDKGKLQIDFRPKQVRTMGPKSWSGPEAAGSTADWIVDACGYTFRMYSCAEVVHTAASTVDGITVPTQEVETGRYEIRVWLKQHENYAGRGCFPRPELVPESIGGSPQELYAQLMQVIRGQG